MKEVPGEYIISMARWAIMSHEATRRELRKLPTSTEVEQAILGETLLINYLEDFCREFQNHRWFALEK